MVENPQNKYTTPPRFHISNTWTIQNTIKHFPDTIMSTTDIMTAIRQNPGGESIKRDLLTNTLSNMDCVEVYPGSRGGHIGKHNPNKYKFLGINGSCPNCHFEKSSSVGCLILHPEMGKKFGLT